MNFWSRVQELLDKKGISRKQLAHELGIDQSNIGKGIKSGSIPAADVALNIAKYLGVTVDFLCTGKDNSKYTIEHYNKWHGTVEELESMPVDKQNAVVTIIHSMSNEYKSEKNKAGEHH